MIMFLLIYLSISECKYCRNIKDKIPIDRTTEIGNKILKEYIKIFNGIEPTKEDRENICKYKNLTIAGAVNKIREIFGMDYIVTPKHFIRCMKKNKQAFAYVMVFMQNNSIFHEALDEIKQYLRGTNIISSPQSPNSNINRNININTNSNKNLNPYNPSQEAYSPDQEEHGPDQEEHGPDQEEHSPDQETYDIGQDTFIPDNPEFTDGQGHYLFTDEQDNYLFPDEQDNYLFPDEQDNNLFLDEQDNNLFPDEQDNNLFPDEQDNNLFTDNDIF